MSVRAVMFSLLLGAAACHSPPHAPVSPAGGTAPDYCGMALSALRETIASNDVQPYGLEDVCVRRLASTSGHIFVDARFTETAGSAPISAPSCSGEGFVVRFDPKRFERSPTQGVVLLVISRSASGAIEFNAVVEQADWPSKRPGIIGLSPCGSAFGTIRSSAKGWAASVVQPPRSPDAL